MTWWHGGPSGLRPGDLLTPQHDEGSRCVACSLPRLNMTGELSGHERLVLLTDDRDVGRLFAGMNGRGDLYQVEPDGQPQLFEGQWMPVFGVAAARVRVVYQRAVTMTGSQREAFLRRRTAALAVMAGQPHPDSLPPAQRREAYAQGSEAFYAGVRTGRAALDHRWKEFQQGRDPLGLDRAHGWGQA